MRRRVKGWLALSTAVVQTCCWPVQTVSKLDTVASIAEVETPVPPVLPPPCPAEYCCNGTVIEDEELGKVLQLQGDQRKNVSAFLLGNQLCKKDQIKVHGS